MHNLSFVVTRAESPQDACDNVETLISDFGSEDNWHTICGCVSEKNKVFINDSSGRYSPKTLAIQPLRKLTML